MSKPGKERRQFDRFTTDVEVFYQIEYDFETKVDYQRVIDEKNHLEKQKHHAISRNVSAEGLAFIAPEMLKTGSKLKLEVYLPGDGDPIPMTGQVRWASADKESKGEPVKYITGVQVLTVAGQPVKDTIKFDEAHKMYWSLVLESILGKFKIIGLKRQGEKG